MRPHTRVSGEPRACCDSVGDPRAQEKAVAQGRARDRVAVPSRRERTQRLGPQRATTFSDALHTDLAERSGRPCPNPAPRHPCRRPGPAAREGSILQNRPINPETGFGKRKEKQSKSR